jgi:hypothetical protein
MKRCESQVAGDLQVFSFFFLFFSHLFPALHVNVGTKVVDGNVETIVLQVDDTAVTFLYQLHNLPKCVSFFPFLKAVRPILISNWGLEGLSTLCLKIIADGTAGE